MNEPLIFIAFERLRFTTSQCSTQNQKLSLNHRSHDTMAVLDSSDVTL